MTTRILPPERDSDLVGPTAPILPFWGNDRRLMIIRFAVAGGCSALLCLVLRYALAPTLTAPIDIVGYPSVFNFNFHPRLFEYRLGVYAFPLVFLATYMVLRKWGPLRRQAQGIRTAAIPLVDFQFAHPETEAQNRPRWDVIVRLAVPAGVVVASVGARTGHTDLVAVSSGLVYLLVVLALAACIRWFLARRTREAVSYWDALAYGNGVAGGAAAMLGMWFVSRHTVVLAGGSVRPYPWFPLWLALAGVAAVVWWTARQVLRGRPGRSVERSLVVLVVGAIGVFLVVSRLPGDVVWFQGYDDAQELTGAELLGKGFFPWRDLLYIHGLYPDALAGLLGKGVFGDSVWGLFAFHTVVLAPLGWVVTYLFAAWVSRASGWLAVFVLVGVGTGVTAPLLADQSLTVWDGPRFLVVPLALIVLGKTIEKRTWPWCTGLILLLLAQAVLIPETGLLVPPALAAVVAADIVHRDRAVPLWQSLRATARCAAVGLAAMVVLIGYLAWFDALRPFIDYYLVFGPGHSETGALPPTGITRREYGLLFAGVAAVLLTFWATAARVLRGAAWDPRDWVAVAAAGFVALYTEKALVRFDYAHVGQVFGVALPLVLMWVWRAAESAGRADLGSLAAVRGRRIQLGSAFIAVMILFLAAAYFKPLVGRLRNVDNRHLVSATVPDPSLARLGYAPPGTVDAAMMRDLDAILRRYAGDGPVFDMTNSPGYVYYLLGRVPGTRFSNVSLAIQPYAQRLLIEELERSRPPVVIFDSTAMGLPIWDDISNNIRHYLVSQYILDHWVPVVRSHGNLIMVRRDLVAGTPPPGDQLWFGGPGCAWGAAPNYLSSPPSGPSIDLSVRHVADGAAVDLTGWAVDPDTRLPADAVVLVSDGEVVAVAEPSTNRADVAERFGPAAAPSGFHLSGVLKTRDRPSVYALGADGDLHPLPGITDGPGGLEGTAIRFPDGRMRTIASTTAGRTESYQASPRILGEIETPPGLRLSDFDLATVSTDAGVLGRSLIQITDQLGTTYHDISVQALEDAGSRLAVRVGGCLQWHGYDPERPLYVVQSGDAPITSVALSGVGA